MPDHDHSEYATRSELNGFGCRVDTMKERVAAQEAKMGRTEQDVTKLFVLVEALMETTRAFELSSQKAVGEMQVNCEKAVASIGLKVSALKWWIIGGLGAIGVFLRILFPAGYFGG